MTPTPPTAPPTRVEYPWALRVWRSLRFGLARLASRDGYVQARAAPFDLTFTGPGADVITRHIYRLGAHEPVITRYLLEHVHLGPGDVALDVGANIGWYSVLLDRLSEPGAQIFAFEPDPKTYGLLTRNLAANAGRARDGAATSRSARRTAPRSCAATRTATTAATPSSRRRGRGRPCRSRSARSSRSGARSSWASGRSAC